ncbi:MAG: hypothetical protein AABZ65_04340 [Candidatus Omnitrophota bacterium]
MLEHSEIAGIMGKTVKMMNSLLPHLNNTNDDAATQEAIQEYLSIRSELRWLCDKFEHSLLNDPDIQWIWKDKPNMSWLNIYDRISFINRKLFTIL